MFTMKINCVKVPGKVRYYNFQQKHYFKWHNRKK